MSDEGTVCVWAARPALMVLQTRGIRVAPILEDAGLSPIAVENTDARLPMAGVARFWDLAAAAAGDPFFGVHVAETVPPGSADLLEYLGSASATLREAYERIARYTRLFYDQGDLQVIIEPLHARLVRRTMLAATQLDEFMTAYKILRGQQWTGSQWRPERLRFQHAAPAGRTGIPALFGCEVQFSTPEVDILCAKEVFALRLVNADSRLLDILLRYAEVELQRLPAPADLTAKVAASIALQLASPGVPTLPSTAAALRLSPRALQRRLAAVGLTHSKLLDRVRRDLALKYIVHATMSVYEIAHLLDFSDGTAFYRAFKRWTGLSPLAYRRQALTASRPA